MKRTLRSGNGPERPRPSRSRGSHQSELPGASTAAYLAWETTDSRTSPDAQPRGESSILPSFLRPRKPAATPRQPLSNTSPRPSSSLQAQASTEPPPLSPRNPVRDPRSESPSTSTSASPRALNSAAFRNSPGATDPGTRSASPSSSSSRVAFDPEPIGITGKARKAPVKRGRCPIEEKIGRNPEVPGAFGAARRAEQGERPALSRDRQTSPRRARPRRKERALSAGADVPQRPEDRSASDDASSPKPGTLQSQVLGNLPDGIDRTAARQILSELSQDDEVHWEDIAGLEAAKNSLREAVVYPFLRPDLFIGLRQPACGILLFGPPGTGKTMLARAVATESKSTFFSLSASSLTSKYLGDSEKLVRALFAIARTTAPSIIFVDEIDSLLGQRSGTEDHETTRRIKTEFLIQWSNLQRSVPPSDDPRDSGGANRVLVLAATNLPWAIDEAARRRFVKRQYIPLPEPETRGAHLRRLLSQQNHTLTDRDIDRLVALTDGMS